MDTELNAIHDTVEGIKEKLVNDLRGVRADIDDLLKDVANSTTEEIAAARAKIEGTLGEATSRLADARIAVTEKAKGAADATHAYVRENPWKVFGVAAAAAGFIIGFLLSRR